MGLDLNDLQAATIERGKAWGSPGLQFRGLELAGETAELVEQVLNLQTLVLNLVKASGKASECLKKIVRHQNGMAGGNPSLDGVKAELGDVVISAALFANELGLNLAEITAAKFNETSRKYGFDVLLPEKKDEEPPLIAYTNLLHRVGTTDHPEIREFVYQHRDDTTLLWRMDVLNALFVMNKVRRPSFVDHVLSRPRGWVEMPETD